jgi:hypothetical protein
MPLIFLIHLKSSVFKLRKALKTQLSVLIMHLKRINDKSQKNGEIPEKSTDNAEKSKEIYYFLEFPVHF